MILDHVLSKWAVLVRREARPMVPPRVENSLTPLEQELAGHLPPLLSRLQVNAGAMVEGGEPARMP